MDFPVEIRRPKKPAAIEAGKREAMTEEHRRAFREALPNLIWAAQAARDRAVSYRGFLVGASVFAWDADKQQYLVYTAGNFRPEKGVVPPRGAEKRCAERNAIESALNDDVDLIVGIVTVSTEKTTGDEKPGHAVLHPCEDCLVLIGSTPQIKPDAIFHGVHDHRTRPPAELKPRYMLKGETTVINEEEITVQELLETGKPLL